MIISTKVLEELKPPVDILEWVSVFSGLCVLELNCDHLTLFPMLAIVGYSLILFLFCGHFFSNLGKQNLMRLWLLGTWG